MNPLNKIFLVVVLVLVAILSALVYSSWKQEQALFSAVEASLSEDEQGRFVFSSTIRNDGNQPIDIIECGYVDIPGCEAGCGDVGIVQAGETFVAKVVCDPSVTPEDIANSDFYIQNRPEGGNLQNTYGGTSEFPNFGSGLLPPVGSSSSGGGGGGGGSVVAGGPPGAGSSNPHGTGVTTALGSSTLAVPDFISVTPGSDNTPTVHFGTPLVNFITVDYCRMDIVDRSYFEMSSSNGCSDVSAGLGHCTLSQPLADGSHTLSVACSNSNTQSAAAVYNGQETNLDVPIVIDTTSPVISNVVPSEGNLGSGINGVVVNGDVSGDAVSCSAGVYSAVYSHVNVYSLPISVSLSNSHFSFTLPLASGNNYAVLVCVDDLLNVARYDTGNYFVALTTSSLIDTTTQESGSGGSPSTTDVGDEGSAGGSGGSGSDRGKEGPTGETVRDFNSQRTIFQWFADLFRNIFS